MDIDFQDCLLNDWGIHHLHLGLNIDESGFVVRTNDLLFVRFTDTAAYLLGILPHGRWAEPYLVEIIHRNWPQSIARYRLNDVIGTDAPQTEEAFRTARKHGYQVFFNPEPGYVYTPVGGGYSTAGTSVRALNDADHHAVWVRHLEKHIRENIDHYVAVLRDSSREVPVAIHFRLLFDENGWYAVEQNLKTAIWLHPLKIK